MSGNNLVAFAESDGQFLLDLAADSGSTRTLSPRSKLQLMIRSVRAETCEGGEYLSAALHANSYWVSASLLPFP